MPPRWLSAAIVVFWLGMTGWLAWRELWPRWRAGDPPPFHIDLVEEVHRANTQKIRWAVLEDDHETTSAESSVGYDEKADAFALVLTFKEKPAALRPPAGRMVPRMRFVSSKFVVTREGRLRELQVEAAVTGAVGPLPVNSTLLLAGQVRDERFYPRYEVRQAGLTLLEGHLSPVAVSYHGSVLVPQHPVNRITGLRPGQSWRMPVVDPFAAALGFGEAVRHINARVLPETHVLEWKDRKPTNCLVIEYEGEDEKAATWVEVGTDLVQRQEAAFAGRRLVLQRDD
jgi:hypothetical protein